MKVVDGFVVLLLGVIALGVLYVMVHVVSDVTLAVSLALLFIIAVYFVVFLFVYLLYKALEDEDFGEGEVVTGDVEEGE